MGSFFVSWLPAGLAAAALVFALWWGPDRVWARCYNCRCRSGRIGLVDGSAKWEVVCARCGCYTGGFRSRLRARDAWKAGVLYPPVYRSAMRSDDV